MARKSLSSQVIEELDRARGILRSLQDSSDPIPAILVGTALESLHRIETMCLAARQSSVNDIVRDNVVEVPIAATRAVKESPATHKRTRRSNVALKQGEKR
jgi:hypothetical protein